MDQRTILRIIILKLIFSDEGNKQICDITMII